MKMKFTLLIVIIAVLATSQALRMRNRLETATDGPLEDYLRAVSLLFLFLNIIDENITNKLHNRN